MDRVFGWSVFALIIWAIVSLTVMLSHNIFPGMENEIKSFEILWINTTSSIGRFFAPIVQFALVIMVIIEAAKRIGLIDPDKPLFSKSFYEEDEHGQVTKSTNFFDSENTQSVLAIIIVITLCIGSLTGLPGIGILNDLALVVVGFYFGSRIKKGEEVVWYQAPNTPNDRDKQRTS